MQSQLFGIKSFGVSFAMLKPMYGKTQHLFSLLFQFLTQMKYRYFYAVLFGQFCSCCAKWSRIFSVRTEFPWVTTAKQCMYSAFCSLILPKPDLWPYLFKFWHSFLYKISFKSNLCSEMSQAVQQHKGNDCEWESY